MADLSINGGVPKRESEIATHANFAQNSSTQIVEGLNKLRAVLEPVLRPAEERDSGAPSGNSTEASREPATTIGRILSELHLDHLRANSIISDILARLEV